MTTPTTAATKKRSARRDRIEHACVNALALEAERAKKVAARNTLLADSQGPAADGKFTYTELSEISGLTRTRVAQIIRKVRQGVSP